MQLNLSLGLKLTKNHRILQFDQSDGLKSYIDFNTVKRTVAKTSFEKVFFKLMNNSVYGKSVHRLKEPLTLNKPAYVDISILDISKSLMYDFHYNYIKNNNGKKA